MSSVLEKSPPNVGDRDSLSPPSVTDSVEKLPLEGNEMDLFEACKLGDIAEVKKLMNTNSVNLRDSTGRKSTPLHFAAGEF